MKLTIEKAVYGGDALGRDADGRAVFVPYALPGERVEVALTGERGGPARAQLVQVEEVSPDRVAARCRHFGRCGGCQYQHARYESQLAMKADILSETLERAGLRDRPRMTVHAGEPWGYRNRIRLRVEVRGGLIQLGYNIRDTRDFLPIEECPIAAPVLWRMAQALLDLSNEHGVCGHWLRAAAEIELFCTGDERAVQITFFMREKRSAGFAELCEGVKLLAPELVGAGAEFYADGGKRTTARFHASASWGKGGIHYLAAGREYWVTRSGFFQVNRFLVEELVRVVTEGHKGLIVWDLFAGVGLFSRALAEVFDNVLAIEANAKSIRDLEAAKKANLRAIAVPVVEFLREAVIGREWPELVVMDPPRAGVGMEACRLLARMQVPQIVYVSCDPATLARDLRVMVDSGYNLAELHLVDLFPQTFHLETVAVLQR